MSTISRRTVAKGAAWSVPAVAVAGSVPAFAASPNCTPAIQQAIEKAFTNYKTSLGTYVNGCGTTSTFTIWYASPPLISGSDGFTANSEINVRNETGCSIDVSKYPLWFRIDIKLLEGSTDAIRRFSLSTSNATFHQVSDTARVGNTLANGDSYAGAAEFQKTATNIRSIYWKVNDGGLNRLWEPGEDVDVNFQWNDGGLTDRKTATYQLVPLGFAPLTWEQVKVTNSIITDACYNYYVRRVNTWITTGEGCLGINWNVATSPTRDFFNQGGFTRTQINCLNGIYSNTAGDFGADNGIY